jgi:hypothetical protein
MLLSYKIQEKVQNLINSKLEKGLGLTVRGLGSRIHFISSFAPGEKYGGHAKSALEI